MSGNGVRMLKKEISLRGRGDFLFGVNGAAAELGDRLAKGERVLRFDQSDAEARDISLTRFASARPQGLEIQWLHNLRQRPFQASSAASSVDSCGPDMPQLRHPTE